MGRIGLVVVILSLVGTQEIYSDILDTPYMAAIFWLQEGSYKFYCNGAIISSRHVLTTATCARYPVGLRNMMVRVGSSNHLYGGQERYVDTVNQHFKFSPDLDSDIAVLKLNEPLKLSYRIALVNLPEQDLFVVLPSVTYYGNDKLSGGSFNTLEQSKLSNYSHYGYMNNSQCNLYFKRHSENKDLVTENMICGRPSNYPDIRIFGAPLVYDGIIYGLCSWDHKVHYDAPLIFTRVAAFTDWIKNWIR